MERIEMQVPCGWCITGMCEDCLPEMEWQNKVYVCVHEHVAADSEVTESATVRG